MTTTSETSVRPTWSGRQASLEAVLAFAWDNDVFTSSDVMPAVGLTRSTTIEAIDDLIAWGLVRELPNARAVDDYRRGRPARRFELREDAGLIVGVDAGRLHLSATVADLRGRPLASVAHETGALTPSDVDDPAEAGSRRAAVQAVIDEALHQAGGARGDVFAVCVGVPAPVDRAGRSPVHRNAFWRRMNPELGGMLSTWAPAVRIENDASLAAVAEGAVGAARGCDDFVALLAGERLGAGVVIDGRLVRGAHGGAGEAKALDRVEGVGRADGVGHWIARWTREAIESGEIPPEHPLARRAPDELSARDVLALAGTGDPWVEGIVERAGALLARVAGVFASFFDPQVIVIAGAVAAGIHPVIDAARILLPGEVDMPAPQLLASTLGAGVVTTGAVAAALETARATVLPLAAERAGA